MFVGLLGWALASAGRKLEAKELLEELQHRSADSPALAPEACLMAALGDLEGALKLMSRAIDEFAPFAYYLGLPCFDVMRDDSRFGELEKRLSRPF